MAEIAFHGAARIEYVSAIKYYRDRSIRAALRLESEMEGVFADLQANPHRFPTYEGNLRVASLLKFPYSVIYEVNDDIIWVIAIVHASREPDYWRDRTL